MLSQFNRFGTFNAVLPKEGPCTYPFNLDFTATTVQELDFTPEINNGTIGFISGFWCDNSANPVALTVEVQGTGQRVKIPANKQAYMPILSTNDPKLLMTTDSGPDIIIPFYACNFPVWPIIY
jgi:hypothetical protein